MNHFKVLAKFTLVIFSGLFIGCSSHTNQEANPALFETKTEAEKAAKKFNCKGAHQMGDKWMPCEGHKEHNDHSIKIGQ